MLMVLQHDTIVMVKYFTGMPRAGFSTKTYIVERLKVRVAVPLARLTAHAGSDGNGAVGQA